MTGAEYVAKFLKAIGIEDVFLVQGGACAFMVDAVAKEAGIDYKCFQHEQGAAMAADAVYRVSGKIGATFSTSGPGASNLITGIACGYYDSIPSFHVTGQVNGKEQAQYRGAKVRQAGFQQMDIVGMVSNITTYAAHVKTIDELKTTLKVAAEKMLQHRMGPVLVDIPMDVQTETLEDDTLLLPNYTSLVSETGKERILAKISEFLSTAERPLVVIGGGVVLADVQNDVEEWLTKNNIPFVASWSALNGFNHSNPLYCGHFGVYGNRGGNYIIQNADKIVVLGSRLDNRQRSGNTSLFAPNAKILVCDIDPEELFKYDPTNYETIRFDLSILKDGLQHFRISKDNVRTDWYEYITSITSKYLNKDISTSSTLSPYAVVRKMQSLMKDDAILFTDAGANHVWVYQSFNRTKNQQLHTSSGHYAMGYSLPAAIGAKFALSDKQIISLNGDGGIQMNIQELQTLIEYDLDVKIVIFNNKGLGMIKQFQDSYMGSRYEATGSGKGPGRPNFELIAAAYNLNYFPIHSLDDIEEDIFDCGRAIIEVMIDEKTLIEPKLEMGRPINDQFPYVSNEEYTLNNKFVKYSR